MTNKEYKVITSNTPIFAKSARLREILAEEAQAGWDLEELLDSNKIRVGRDRAARVNDGSCNIDPYRIHVGMNNVLYLGSAALLTILVIYAIVLLAAMSLD